MRWRRPRPPLAAAKDIGRLVLGEVAGAASRHTQSRLGLGEHGRPLGADAGRTVLLFFEDVERDRFVPNDRHLRRGLRRLYHSVTEGQRVSGFELWFRLLCTALERAGCRVVVNNARLARRHPEHPVGICGYPHILERWALPNPAVLGPGLFDHPSLAPRLFDDARFRSYLVTCEWMKSLFEPVYGPRCHTWCAGIDLAEWPDYGNAPKDIDLLVYDKIRWQREHYQAALVRPILAEAERRRLTVAVLPYGGYDQQQYRQLLARSRGMLFLTEHETQGLAYQQALACGIPLLAWDNGFWLDPQRARYGADPVPAASVPYFSPDCGETFADADAFSPALDRFISRLAHYQPRRYVQDHLSFERSARAYLDAYMAAAPDRPRTLTGEPAARMRHVVPA